jgi:alkyl sulfatase BDS1-like metallo-beta-lactamase superfamily hydrolase
MKYLALTTCVVLLLGFKPVCGEESGATKLLKARSEQLKPRVTQVSKSVYCASGYSPANIAMIVGNGGVVIVDTGMFPTHAEAVLAEFRKISDLPVAGIILTHGHGDHPGRRARWGIWGSAVV